MSATEIIDRRALGAWVRSLRQGKGMSINKVATLSGVGYSSVLRIEQGPDARNTATKRPRADTVARVLIALGVDEIDAAHVLGASEWATDVATWMRSLRAVGEDVTREDGRIVPGVSATDSTIVRLRVPVGAIVTVSMN